MTINVDTELQDRVQPEQPTNLKGLDHNKQASSSHSGWYGISLVTWSVTHVRYLEWCKINMAMNWISHFDLQINLEIKSQLFSSTSKLLCLVPSLWSCRLEGGYGDVQPASVRHYRYLVCRLRVHSSPQFPPHLFIPNSFLLSWHAALL